MGSDEMTVPVVLVVHGDKLHTTDAATQLRNNATFNVHSVPTPAEALQALSSRADIECLLISQELPGTDGISFVERLRESHPDLPVVLYPAHSSETLAIQAISADVSEYLPHTETSGHVQDLLDTIHDAIDSDWVERALQERLKELTAIQQLTPLLTGQATTPLPDVLASVANKIPPSFQYPPITEAQIIVEDTTIATDRFDEVTSTLTTRTHTPDGTEIVLTVGYTEQRPEADEGPFLHEEHALCETLTALLRGSIERRKYLESLTETEQVFRELTENIKEVAWVSDHTKSEMLYVNPAYERVWGRSAESLYDDPESFLNAIYPEDSDRVERAVTEQASGAYDEEYRIVRPNGEVRWIHDRAVPVTNEKKRPVSHRRVSRRYYGPERTRTTISSSQLPPQTQSPERTERCPIERGTHRTGSRHSRNRRACSEHPDSQQPLDRGNEQTPDDHRTACRSITS